MLTGERLCGVGLCCPVLLLPLLPAPHLALGFLAAEVWLSKGSTGLLGPTASWRNKRVLFSYTYFFGCIRS